MRKTKRLSQGAVVMVVAACVALIAGTPAQAQLPPVPQLPRVELPEPVADAAIMAIDTVLPVIGNTAIQARPLATAVGFGLRAPCAAVGGATFIVALGSSIVVLPVPTGVFLGPAVIFCSGAFEEGPADPLVEQVDGATGATFEEQAGMVADQVSGALEPAKSNLDEGCGVVKIFAEVPRQLPPPLHRIDYIAMVCD